MLRFCIYGVLKKWTQLFVVLMGWRIAGGVVLTILDFFPLKVLLDEILDLRIGCSKNCDFYFKKKLDFFCNIF